MNDTRKSPYEIRKHLAGGKLGTDPTNHTILEQERQQKQQHLSPIIKDLSHSKSHRKKVQLISPL